jgi:hypothetical protein
MSLHCETAGQELVRPGLGWLPNSCITEQWMNSSPLPIHCQTGHFSGRAGGSAETSVKQAADTKQRPPRIPIRSRFQTKHQLAPYCVAHNEVFCYRFPVCAEGPESSPGNRKRSPGLMNASRKAAAYPAVILEAKIPSKCGWSLKSVAALAILHRVRPMLSSQQSSLW